MVFKKEDILIKMKERQQFRKFERYEHSKLEISRAKFIKIFEGHNDEGKARARERSKGYRSHSRPR